MPLDKFDDSLNRLIDTISRNDLHLIADKLDTLTMARRVRLRLLDRAARDTTDPRERNEALSTYSFYTTNYYRACSK